MVPSPATLTWQAMVAAGQVGVGEVHVHAGVMPTDAGWWSWWVYPDHPTVGAAFRHGPHVAPSSAMSAAVGIARSHHANIDPARLHLTVNDRLAVGGRVMPELAGLPPADVPPPAAATLVAWPPGAPDGGQPLADALRHLARTHGWALVWCDASAMFAPARASGWAWIDDSGQIRRRGWPDTHPNITMLERAAIDDAAEFAMPGRELLVVTDSDAACHNQPRVWTAAGRTVRVGTIRSGVDPHGHRRAHRAARASAGVAASERRLVDEFA